MKRPKSSAGFTSSMGIRTRKTLVTSCSNKRRDNTFNFLRNNFEMSGALNDLNINKSKPIILSNPSEIGVGKFNYSTIGTGMGHDSSTMNRHNCKINQSMSLYADIPLNENRIPHSRRNKSINSSIDATAT